MGLILKSFSRSVEKEKIVQAELTLLSSSVDFFKRQFTWNCLFSLLLLVQMKKYVVDRLPVLDKNISIGVFAHGVFTKCFLANTIGLDKQTAWKTQIDNTSITHLRYDGNWSLIKVNDSSHINELDI